MGQAAEANSANSSRSADEIWQEIEEQSDHCSGVKDFYRECCMQHDFDYRSGWVSRREADANFRRCIQSRSPFGRLSPMSWWRWAGVRLFGWMNK